MKHVSGVKGHVEYLTGLSKSLSNPRHLVIQQTLALLQMCRSKRWLGVTLEALVVPRNKGS